MEIFANHAHVFPPSHREDGTVAALLALMEECGIARAVCFAPFYEWGLGINPNRWLAEQLGSHHNLVGFGAVNLNSDDIEAQVDEIAALGFPGIKLHPAFQKFKVDGDPARRVYARAEELGLFLSFHTGTHWHRIRDYNMLLFDEVAYSFPKLRFSMEHVGGYCFFSEAMAVLINNKHADICNVYAGLTSVFDNDANRFWYLNPGRINDLLHLVGARQCVFGLDFPYNGTDKVKEAIAAIKALPLCEEDKAGIFGGNLARVLNLTGGAADGRFVTPV